MTPAEVALWSALRGKKLGGLRFRRQHPLGPYVVDFFCVSQRLVVEVDGGVHADADRTERDAVRDGWIRQQKLRLLRVSNELVLTNMAAALTLIETTARTPPVYD